MSSCVERPRARGERGLLSFFSVFPHHLEPLLPTLKPGGSDLSFPPRTVHPARQRERTPQLNELVLFLTRLTPNLPSIVPRSLQQKDTRERGGPENTQNTPSSPPTTMQQTLARRAGGAMPYLAPRAARRSAVCVSAQQKTTVVSFAWRAGARGRSFGRRRRRFFVWLQVWHAMRLGPWRASGARPLTRFHAHGVARGPPDRPEHALSPSARAIAQRVCVGRETARARGGAPALALLPLALRAPPTAQSRARTRPCLRPIAAHGPVLRSRHAVWRGGRAPGPSSARERDTHTRTSAASTERASPPRRALGPARALWSPPLATRARDGAHTSTRALERARIGEERPRARPSSGPRAARGQRAARTRRVGAGRPLATQSM